MTNWWESLTELQHIFAFIGIPATLVLIVQTVLLFFGIGDGDVDVDADIDVDGIDPGEIDTGDGGLALFSVRGIVAMLCIAGWSGIVFVDFGLPNALCVVLAAVCGIAALFGMAYLLKGVSKLQSSGNIQLGSAIGKVGEVYIPIPAAGEGKGKISITVQDRFIELDAISNGDSPIKTGDSVRVVSVNEAGLAVVERIMTAKQI